VDPDGLVIVWAASADNPENRGSMSVPDIRDIAELPAVETMIGYREMTATVTSGDEPELVEASRSTDGLMATFGVRPHRGRDLTREDAEAGRPEVVVVGYRYWQERFGGRADAIGRVIEISDVAYEIIGVAPAGFDFPDGAQLWWSRYLDTQLCGRGCHTPSAALRRMHRWRRLLHSCPHWLRVLPKHTRSRTSASGSGRSVLQKIRLPMCVSGCGSSWARCRWFF
jgi:hypothetical protein